MSLVAPRSEDGVESQVCGVQYELESHVQKNPAEKCGFLFVFESTNRLPEKSTSDKTKLRNKKYLATLLIIWEHRQGNRLRGIFFVALCIAQHVDLSVVLQPGLKSLFDIKRQGRGNLRRDDPREM